MQVKDADGAFALQFPVFMNRPGKFTVEITATDRVTKKTASYKLAGHRAAGDLSFLSRKS
jgi:hypothetical protein